MRKADNLPPSCAVVTESGKSGNLKFLEPCGTLQACNGTDFTNFYHFGRIRLRNFHLFQVLELKAVNHVIRSLRGGKNSDMVAGNTKQ